MNRLLVVDGHNLVMRSLKAMQGKQVALSHNGINTGPLLVFVRMLNRYIAHVRPTHVVVCWDAPGPCWREELEPTYKANRHRRTEDEESERYNTFLLVRQWLSLSNVLHVVRQGYEADDLVAAYVRQYRYSFEVVILSGDKDLLQLVSPQVTQIRPQSSLTPDEETWDVNRVVGKFGLHGKSLALAAALTGDKSDNISGVPGIGPVTAAKLVNASTGISGLLEMDRCRDHRDVILLNHKLVDLGDPEFMPEVERLPPFHPTNHGSLAWPALQGFLRDHQLHSLTEIETGWEARENG